MSPGDDGDPAEVLRRGAVLNLIARLEGLAEVAVVGVPDERLGEVRTAHVIRQPRAIPTSEHVIDFTRGRLASFKVPREVAFVDDLPRNIAAKVLNSTLRQAPEARGSR